MMYSYVAAAALAGSVSASVLPRTDGCCFQLNASGGESGTIGQLSDGQNRIGGGYAPATYCISNGEITDSSGRGCILTPPTTQLQCDVGATPTSGFSISGSGEVEYNGSGTFYACGASASEYNLYTKPVENQKDCHEVKLSTGGKCAGNGGAGGGAGQSSSASAPKESSSASAPASGPPAYSSAKSTPVESKPAPSMPAESKPTPSMPAYSAPVESKPAETIPSAPAPSAPAPSAPAPSMPAVQPPVSAPVCPAPVTITVTEACQSGPGPAAPPASAAPPAGTAPPASSPASPPVVPVPSAGSSAAPPPPVSSPNAPASSPNAAAPPAGTPASPPAVGSACQTALTGAYQTPHLVLPISSEKPDVPQGTSYFGEVSSTTSTIFNFDIPAEYAGKQCTLVFMFPEKKDLTTSDYTMSGSGSLGCSELSSVASQSTSYSNAPSVAKDLGDVAVQPGNSYVVATGDCKAGTTQSIELSSKGGLALHFFQDYNPSPLGLFMTSC
jgi:hypothetical protein